MNIQFSKSGLAAVAVVLSSSISLLIFDTLIASVKNYGSRELCESLLSTKNSTTKKVILLATTFFGSQQYATSMYGDDCSQQCIILPPECRQFDDIIRQADAVVFHAVRSDLAMGLLELQHFRFSTGKSDDQVWVLFSLESPDTLSNTLGTELSSRRLDRFFDWTMSYRRDADVHVHPSEFGGFKPIEQSELQQNHNDIDITNKRHMAAVISNCRDSYGRLQLLHQLSSYGLQVDIFGLCSPDGILCPGERGSMAPECYSFLQSRYLFYASFENSLCRDYVTEKFTSILAYDMVPVVVGGANYSAVAPFASFVDVSTFASPQELAEFLIKLSKNSTLYNSYFAWKRLYRVNYSSDNLPLCTLCRKLYKQKVTGNFAKVRKTWSARAARKNGTCWSNVFPKH